MYDEPWQRLKFEKFTKGQIRRIKMTVKESSLTDRMTVFTLIDDKASLLTEDKINDVSTRDEYVPQ